MNREDSVALATKFKEALSGLFSPENPVTDLALAKMKVKNKVKEIYKEIGGNPGDITIDVFLRTHQEGFNLLAGNLKTFLLLEGFFTEDTEFPVYGTARVGDIAYTCALEEGVVINAKNKIYEIDVEIDYEEPEVAE